MITLTPALRHSIIAAGTLVLGGSSSEINPRKVKPYKEKLKFLGLETLNEKLSLGYLLRGKCNLANPKTLSPYSPKT